MILHRLGNVFPFGMKSVEDYLRPGRPLNATTLDKDNFRLVLSMPMRDRRIPCLQIGERMGMPFERADNIVTKELGFYRVRPPPLKFWPEMHRVCSAEVSFIQHDNAQPHLNGCYRNNLSLWIWTCFPSILFTRISPPSLSSIPLK